MPRLTDRVFTDLAIWMSAFGLFVGLVFPPFCLLLGLPPDKVLTPLFGASTILWSQAVIAEVYALNAFFTIALVYLALR